jgi:hypothetical protein
MQPLEPVDPSIDLAKWKCRYELCDAGIRKLALYHDGEWIVPFTLPSKLDKLRCTLPAALSVTAHAAAAAVMENTYQI